MFGLECLAFSKEGHLSFYILKLPFTKENKTKNKIKQGNNPQTMEDKSKGEYDSRFHLLQERLDFSILKRII